MKLILRLILLAPLLLAACGDSPTATPIAAPTAAPTSTTAPQASTPTTAVAPTSTATPPLPTASPTTLPEVYLMPVAAEASSFDNAPGFAPSPDPMNAADGDPATRWAPQNGLDNQWIYFDLGKTKTLDHVRITWEDAYATAYELQVSGDAQNWTTAAKVDNGDGGVDDVLFAPVQARYLRMFALGRKFKEFGTSIWELEIYGPAAANPGDKPYAETFASLPTPTPLVMEAPAPAPAGGLAAKMQTGVNYNSWRELEYISAESDATLAYLAANGANAVAIVPTWYMQDIKDTNIQPWPGRGGRTPTDADIAHVINAAHKLGMRVMLKPHVDMRTAESRTDLYSPDAPWYASYTRFILHYAQLAQTYNVELFSIATELDGTIPGHEQEWAAIISAIRTAYSGKLTYASNWPFYDKTPFWSLLDYIGIDAYWPITDEQNPSDARLQEVWRNLANNLGVWRDAQKLTQPLIFTEIGYRSLDGSNRSFSAPASNTPAPDQQAAVLKAALDAMGQYDWFQGIYYWNYLPAANVEDPTGFTVRGKPAEQVLFNTFKEWDTRP